MIDDFSIVVFKERIRVCSLRASIFNYLNSLLITPKSSRVIGTGSKGDFDFCSYLLFLFTLIFFHCSKHSNLVVLCPTLGGWEVVLFVSQRLNRIANCHFQHMVANGKLGNYRNNGNPNNKNHD